jgi:signal transduction histidine kinase/DNA-binding response OmpR family regulator
VKSFFLLIYLVSGIQPSESAQFSSLTDSLRQELTLAKNVEDSVYILSWLAWSTWETDRQSTIEYGTLALKLSERVENKERLAVAYDAAALAYWLKGNVDKAKKLYLEELKIGQQYNLTDRVAWAYFNMSELELLRKNYNEAHELAAKARDEFLKIDDVEAVIRTDAFLINSLKAIKEIEQARAEEELRSQTQQKYFFVAGFLLVSILGFVLYKSYKRKQKDGRILLEQKLQIEEMLKKVHEADQKKLNFFTNISHEFRTPLTLILGPVEKLIKDNSFRENTASLLSIIRRNTLQLFNLVNQLLDIRKLDTSNLKLQVSVDDISSYCNGIFSSFYHLMEENNIAYTCNLTDGKILGWFDKSIIEKILNNILSNAFKYTPKGGKINVTLSPVLFNGSEISHVRIIISDNGKGIPPDQLQYVFDRYYQVENTNTGFNTGTGIGLAYSRELVELHKGQITVDSQINKGTSFTVTLPVNRSFYSENEIAAAQEQETNVEHDSMRQEYLKEIVSLEQEDALPQKLSIIDADQKVMLIVEDSRDMRDFIKNIFSNEYLIYEAFDGVSGYKLAGKLIPNIIICDIMMPQMNGLELCGKLKGNIHTNHIPVLILTAKSGEENEIEGLKTGADDYLTKPFNSEILQMRVNRLIKSGEILKEYFTKEFLLKPGIEKSASPEDEFLKKAVKIVEDNITNPAMNVEFLMKELGVSRTQLFRKLKATTNYSANHFIRNIKLKKAAQFLQQNSHNITEVLYRSGFNSPSYFATCFKEMYGCLPSEYKNVSKPI